METRCQEQRRVLRVERVAMVLVNDGRHVPFLLLHKVESEVLDQYAQHHLTKQRRKHLSAHEIRGRAFPG